MPLTKYLLNHKITVQASWGAVFQNTVRSFFESRCFKDNTGSVSLDARFISVFQRMWKKRDIT